MGLLENFSEHPTNSRYTVFKFYKSNQAEFFKSSLEEDNIWFEESFEDLEHRKSYLFAIKTMDVNKVREKNFIAIGKFRDPFISNKYLRYFIASIAIIVIAFSIIGYLNS